jgi:hypothetical protein
MATTRSGDEITAAKLQIANLLRAGLYIQEICRQTALPETSVRRWAEQLGLPISKCRSGPKAGLEHPEWRGGRTYDKHGYAQIWMPLHPQANNSGRCWEHRVVAEVVHGRYLLPTEVVNHEDGHPRHNWPSNLTVFSSNGDHLRHDLTGRGHGTSPRASIVGAYGSTQKLRRCPDESETLALCPLETRQLIAHFVESHRPTPEHRTLPRRKLRELGAHRDPWVLPSTA